MTKEEVREIMKEAFLKEVAPILEKQKKYEGVYANLNKNEPCKGEIAAKGHGLVRLVKIMRKNNNDQEKALKSLKDGNSRYKDDMILTKYLDSANSIIPSEGGILVPTQYANEIIELLTPYAFLYNVGAEIRTLKTGKETTRVEASTTTSNWVGEEGKIPASKANYDAKNIQLKKLATLTSITSELMDDSLENADDIILRGILREMAVTLSYTALYGSGTEFEPLGIKNNSKIGKQDLNTSITSDILSDIVAMPKQADNPLERSPYWLLNSTLLTKIKQLRDGVGAFIYRDEINKDKTIEGYPFIETNIIGLGSDSHRLTELFFGDFSQFVIGENNGFKTNLFDQGSYVTVDGRTISAVQNDSLILRVIKRIDFALRHEDAFVCVSKIHTK